MVFSVSGAEAFCVLILQVSRLNYFPLYTLFTFILAPLGSLGQAAEGYQLPKKYNFLPPTPSSRDLYRLTCGLGHIAELREERPWAKWVRPPTLRCLIENVVLNFIQFICLEFQRHQSWSVYSCSSTLKNLSRI